MLVLTLLFNGRHSNIGRCILSGSYTYNYKFTLLIIVICIFLLLPVIQSLRFKRLIIYFLPSN